LQLNNRKLAGGKVSIAVTYRPYLCNSLYMKLRLASLDVRIAHVHGVGVAVHNHDRFV